MMLLRKERTGKATPLGMLVAGTIGVSGGLAIFFVVPGPFHPT